MSDQDESENPEEYVLHHFIDGEPVRLFFDEPVSSRIRETEYPSTFFLNNGHKRPIVTLQNKLSTLGRLRGLVKSSIATKSVTAEMASQFIYLFAKENFDWKSSTDWKSFGVQIAKKGDSVTIDSIIEIKEGAEDLSDSVTASLDEDDADVEMMMYLVFMYRICSTKRGGDQRSKIIEKAVDLMKPLSHTPDSISEAAILYESWLVSESYCKLIAAIDMYLMNVGDASKYQKFRFGTISSRHKDCSLLLTYQMISDYCGFESTSELYSWLFFSHLDEGFKKLFKDCEEITKADSYMPYSSEFRLFHKSPYSAASNPEFATFLHVAGSFMGFTRSQNAILSKPLCRGIYNCCYNGLILAFANRKRRFIRTEKGTAKYFVSEKEESISDDSFMGCKTPEDFAIWSQTNDTAISPGLAEFIEIKKKDFTNARSGTVAAYLLHFFP